MGSVTSKRESTQSNGYVNPNPWYPSLSVTNPQSTSEAIKEPILPGSSLYLTFHPSTHSVTASVNIYLANTTSGTDVKQYCHFFTLPVQQRVDIKLRYARSGTLFYTMHGVEEAVHPKGLNLERPVYVLLELLNTKYTMRSTADIELLYVENVNNYEGAPEKADVTPIAGRAPCFVIKSAYEIMELILNHESQKVFINEPWFQGTKFYLYATPVDPSTPCYVHVYLTNTSPQDINKGDIIIVPFRMTYRANSCQRGMKLKLRYTWDGAIACGRNGDAADTDESSILKEWLDLDKSIYVFVEVCNMALDITRMEDGDADDEKHMKSCIRHLGGSVSLPPTLRSVHGQPPPIERDRPRIRLLQNEAGRMRPPAARAIAQHPPSNVPA